jgi:hypothetical protein
MRHLGMKYFHYRTLFSLVHRMGNLPPNTGGRVAAQNSLRFLPHPSRNYNGFFEFVPYGFGLIKPSGPAVSSRRSIQHWSEAPKVPEHQQFQRTQRDAL